MLNLSLRGLGLLFASGLLAAASLPFDANTRNAGAQEAKAERPQLDVPYVPTPEEVVARMLEMAGVDADDYVIDLGSGDGRIAIAAARDHGARAMGVDIDPVRIAEAEENARAAGVEDRVTFKQQNLFETPIGDASVLTLYLLSSVNMELRPRILEEMRPGTPVVSHAFSMGDWEPDQEDSVDGRNVFMWIVPADVEGTWQVTGEPGDFSVTIEQAFQKIEGTATVDGKEVPLQDPMLRGAEISFAVDLGDGPQVFSGRVDGDAIAPVEGDGVQGWQARRGG